VLRLAEAGNVPARVVTASAGNHGQALAHAAGIVGVAVTVYVPEQAPRIKIDAMRHAGAEVVECGDYDDAERRAKQRGATGDATFISPYSHPDVIAGAGTVALEVLDEDPGVELIVVPVGGGGLISGVAIGAGGRAAIYGVEAEASCPFTRSLAAGRVIAIEVAPTLADGLAGNIDPDTITFDLVRRYVAGIVTVAEAEIRAAIRGLITEERLVTEGAAATGVAAIATGRIEAARRRVAVVLTGANIDPVTLRNIL
jgi:threonine dehydratase